MKVLGIRNSPKEVRYAISEKINNDIVVLNKKKENRLIFPKNIQIVGQKLQWLYQELENIILNNPDIDIIAIKKNENVSTNYSKVKETAFFDSIVHLVGAEKNIPVNSYVYKSIGTRSKEVCDFAEKNADKTEKNWNSKMADAIAVTIKELD